jgi:small GTP-binding protein
MSSEHPSSAAANSFTPLTGTDPAAIAAIRVSGPAFGKFAEAHLQFTSDSTLSRSTSGSVRRAALRDTDGDVIDDVVLSVRAAAPIWDIWLHLHGGPWILRRCCELLRSAGFVEAPPDADSIFTAQTGLVAAVAQRLPSMLTLDGVRWLLRQADILPSLVCRLAAAADPHPGLVRRACARLAASFEVCEWYSRPTRIALIGPPNAGKSTLFNRLVGDQVSITCSRPGTTRDWIEAPGELAGFPVVWIDTAGVFEATDALDAAGVDATANVSLTADLRVAVIDATTVLPPAHLRGMLCKLPANPNVIVLNKSDAIDPSDFSHLTVSDRTFRSILFASALNGNGIRELRSELANSLGRGVRRLASPAVFTSSQAERARSATAWTDHKTLKYMILQVVD